MNQAHELDRMVLLVRELTSHDVPYQLVINVFQKFRVLCRADRRNLMSHAGQTALVTFVCLVARMGIQVFLDMPEVRTVGKQPPLHSNFLKQGLVDLGRDLILSSEVQGYPTDKPDLVFVFGDTLDACIEAPSWRLVGDPWVGQIVPLELGGTLWKDLWPIGGMAAAALAAGEVFKAAVKLLQTKSNSFESLLTMPSRSALWDFGSQCPVPERIDCGSCDFISAGAISQALLYALFRIPGMNMNGRVFDDDITDRTNLNRNMLSRRSDVGRGKVSVVSALAGESIVGIPERMSEDALARYAPLAPSVLVGTDDIPVRWKVQEASLGWVGIGGTSHFGIMTSSHKPGEPCGGCLHFKDDLVTDEVIPTVSFVSFWAGLSLAVRFLRHRIGHPYDLRQQSLWLVPLRMDERNAAWWSPVAARNDCPIACAASMNHFDISL